MGIGTSTQEHGTVHGKYHSGIYKEQHLLLHLSTFSSYMKRKFSAFMLRPNTSHGLFFTSPLQPSPHRNFLPPILPQPIIRIFRMGEEKWREPLSNIILYSNMYPKDGETLLLKHLENLEKGPICMLQTSSNFDLPQWLIHQKRIRCDRLFEKKKNFAGKRLLKMDRKKMKIQNEANKFAGLCWLARSMPGKLIFHFKFCFASIGNRRIGGEKHTQLLQCSTDINIL